MSIFSEKDNNKEPTLLEQYLANPDLDFKDIIGMVCDFLLAGIDTVSLIVWALYFLQSTFFVRQLTQRVFYYIT